MTKCNCPSCGKEYDEYQKFCTFCGTPIPAVETPSKPKSAGPDFSFLDEIKASASAKPAATEHFEQNNARYSQRPASVFEQVQAPKTKKTINPIDIIALVIGLIGAVLLTQGIRMQIPGAVCGALGALLACIFLFTRNKASGKTEKIRALSAVAIAVCVIVFAVGIIMNVGTSNDYKKGIAYMNSGDYDEACLYFYNTSGYKDSDELYEECLNLDIYEEAEDALAEGHNYEAYELFTSISDFSDSRKRADDCFVDYPSTGVLHVSPSYEGGTGIIRIISGASMDEPLYVKIYDTSSDELAATVWVSVGDQCDAYLPLGSYNVRYASGSDWFGETDMFGDDGEYVEIDDTTVLDTAGGGIIWTIGTFGGNTSGSNVPQSDF